MTQVNTPKWQLMLDAADWDSTYEEELLITNESRTNSAERQGCGCTTKRDRGSGSDEQSRTHATNLRV